MMPLPATAGCKGIFFQGLSKIIRIPRISTIFPISRQDSVFSRQWLPVALKKFNDPKNFTRLLFIARVPY
jgi:hypothetical protein